MISTTIASLLLLAAPQGTGLKTSMPPSSGQTEAGSTSKTGERFVAVEMLPADSLAVLSVAPVAKHRIMLMKSGLEDIRRFVGASWRKAGSLRELNLSPWNFDTLGKRGFSFAITGLSRDQMSWLLVARTRSEDVDQLRRIMAREHERQDARGNVLKKVRIGELEGWTIRASGGLAISYVVTDYAVVMASSVPAIERALDQRNNVDTSLVATPAYSRFTRACTSANEDEPFASLLVQPKLAFEALLDFLPSDSERSKFRAIARQLELRWISELGMSFFTDGNQVRNFTWIGYPAPRRGLLGTLLGGRTEVDASQLTVVAPDAISATLFTFDLGEIYQESVALAKLLDPWVSDLLRTTVAKIETGSGANLQIQLLPLIGKRAVFQELPRKNHRRVFGLTVELNDGGRLNSALKAMAPTVGFRQGLIGETPAFAFSGSNGTVTLLTIHDDTLILSTTPGFLTATVRRLQAGSGDTRHRLEHQLLHDGEPAHFFRWGDSARLGREWTQMLGIDVGHRTIASELGRIVRVRGGSIVETVRITDSGIAIRTESPYGDPRITLTIAFLLRVAALEGMDTDALTRRRLSLLRDVIAAQYDYQRRKQVDVDGDRLGEFGDLGELIKAGTIGAHRFTDMSSSTGAFLSEDYRVKLFLPNSADDRELNFLGLAWPTPRASGPVYAVTADGSIHRNDILGQTGNLTMCDPRDFFDKGKFGGEILPGWRLVETIMVRRITGDEDSSSRELTAMEGAALEALDKAAETGKVTTEALALLGSKSSFLVARAATVMGELQHKPAMDGLARLVQSHGNFLVVRQAMIALAKMRDRRTIDISITALASPDSVVRAHAAENLGFLHATKGVDALITVLTIDPRPDAPDRIAALLALTDIGQPDCLLACALRVEQPGEQDERALTYLFQTVSSRLETETEAETLIAVLDHQSEMLRGYAIQRLGILALPMAFPALEVRLTKEKTLRHLVEVSLESIRKNKTSEKLKRYASTSKAWVLDIWNRLPQHSTYGIGGGLFIIVFLWRRIRRRRRLARTGERFAAMVAPSEDFGEEEEEEEQDYEEEQEVEYYDDDEYPEYGPEDDGEEEEEVDYAEEPSGPSPGEELDDFFSEDR